MIYIVLGAVAVGVILACVLEARRRKKEKEAFKNFKIDTSEWDM